MEELRQRFKEVCTHEGIVVYDPVTENPELVETQILQSNHLFANNLIQEYKNEFCPKLPRVHFDFVKDHRLNAFAFYDPQTKCGFIGIRTGAVGLIYDLFYRIMSHPEVLPNLGNVGVERLRQPYCSEGIVDDFSKLSILGNNPGGRLAEVFPIDDERKRYAESLALIAIEFFVIHELAHLANGHCEYDNKISSIPLFIEAQSGKSKVGLMVKQYFEVVADAHASLWTWLKRLKNMSDDQMTARSLLEKGNSIVIRTQLLMTDWVLAIVLMFWLFDISTNPDSLHTADHPPAVLRGIWANVHVFGKGTSEIPGSIFRSMIR